MARLIDKSAVVAEIEKLRDELQEKVETSDFIAGEVFIMNYFISLLDFIEVKEVEETEQRMKECPFRQDICNRYRGTQVKCDCKCSWVVDHPKLKELKAKKGE